MATQNQNETENRNGARNRAADAYGTARERTGEALGQVRERAGDYSRRASEQLTTYPVGAVIGGFAVGALAAALLPSTRRETELLGDYGHRLTDTAREAAKNAAEAGRDQIDRITGRAVKEVGSAMVDAVGRE